MNSEYMCSAFFSYYYIRTTYSIKNAILQFTALLAWLYCPAAVVWLRSGAQPARRTTSGSGSSTPAHILQSSSTRHLPIFISRHLPVFRGPMTNCMNSVIVLNYADCISCVYVANFVRPYGHFSFFHCISCLLLH